MLSRRLQFFTWVGLYSNSASQPASFPRSRFYTHYTHLSPDEHSSALLPSAVPVRRCRLKMNSAPGAARFRGKELERWNGHTRPSPRKSRRRASFSNQHSTSVVSHLSEVGSDVRLISIKRRPARIAPQPGTAEESFAADIRLLALVRPAHRRPHSPTGAGLTADWFPIRCHRSAHFHPTPGRRRPTPGSPSHARI